MKKQNLAIDLLRIDGGTQSRLSINEEAVEDYSSVIADSNGTWPFSPVDVFHDGTNYFVADGFHRTLGAERAKRGSISCNVHKGTAKDARIFGMTANDKHGMRMTRADKRACVEWLLDNGGKALTQADIADKAGVSKRLVQGIVAERRPQKAQSARLSSGNANTATRGDGDGSGKQKPDSSSLPPASCEGETPQPPPDTPDSEPADYGRCPNCAGARWTEGDDGVACAKCCHPHGEAAGDVDEERIKTQRQKTVKTAEALMRAFDDLHLLLPKPDEHKRIVNDKDSVCKGLLKSAKGWR